MEGMQWLPALRPFSLRFVFAEHMVEQWSLMLPTSDRGAAPPPSFLNHPLRPF
jgi:hypothetical protein